MGVPFHGMPALRIPSEGGCLHARSTKENGVAKRSSHDIDH